MTCLRFIFCLLLAAACTLVNSTAGELQPLPFPSTPVTVDELGLSDRLRGPSSSGLPEVASPASPEFTQPVPAAAPGGTGAWSTGV